MREARGVAVVFAGGGTGGHLYPALALADALVAERPDVLPFFVGASRGLEARVLPARGLDHLLLPVRGLVRSAPLDNVGVLVALIRSLGRLVGLFRRLRPGLVVVTGGYAGAPAGLVAMGLRVPLALQEQNSLPGITTRLLSRWARQIHLAFPEAVERLPRRARSRARASGNPIRPLAAVDRSVARQRFDLVPDGTVVLIVGGSQGSLALNALVAAIVRDVCEARLQRPEGLQLLWATGQGHERSVRENLAECGSPAWVRVVGYIDDMPAALAAADLAVSRAGAMTTSEFLACGLPAVLVPLPTAAEDHQTANATALERAGAAVLLPQKGLTGRMLWRQIVDLVSDEERVARMRQAARERARPDAAARIAGDLAALLPRAAPETPGGGE